MQHIPSLPPSDEKVEEERKRQSQPTTGALFSASVQPATSVSTSSQSGLPASSAQGQPATSTGSETPFPINSLATLTLVRQTLPAGTTGAAGRLTVIHAETRRKKALPDAEKPAKHLNPRVRHSILLVTTLLILCGTLLTLIPLSSDQNSLPLPAGLNTLIHSAQLAWQIQSHQTNPTPVPAATTAIQAQIPPIAALPTSQYIAIAQQDASSSGISPTYFVRQINLESGFNPNVVSPGGAEGIAQFEPGTAAGLGINPFDPIQALKAAAQMMANAYHMYGDYAKALAAYNAGSANMQAAVNACGANWLSCMSATTQNYVAVIMG